MQFCKHRSGSKSVALMGKTAGSGQELTKRKKAAQKKT
jgi:hypothetical protein